MNFDYATFLFEISKVFSAFFGTFGLPLTYALAKDKIDLLYKPLVVCAKWIYRILPTKKKKAIKYEKQFINSGIYDQTDYAIIIFLKELRASIVGIDGQFKTYEDVLKFVKCWLPDYSDDSDGFFWLHSCELIFKNDKIGELFKEIVGYLSDEHYLSIDFKSFSELIIPRLNLLIDEFDERKFLIRSTK